MCIALLIDDQIASKSCKRESEQSLAIRWEILEVKCIGLNIIGIFNAPWAMGYEQESSIIMFDFLPSFIS